MAIKKASKKAAKKEKTAFTRKFRANDAEVAIFYFLMSKGRIVPGMTMANWKLKTMQDIQVDDPPLPADPTAEARMLGVDLQAWMLAWGVLVPSAMLVFSDKTKTMQDLITFVFDNHQKAGTL